MTDEQPQPDRHRRALALAARWTARRRRHPRPADRRLRDRLPPRPATASAPSCSQRAALRAPHRRRPRPSRCNAGAVRSRRPSSPAARRSTRAGLLRLPLPHRRRRSRAQLQGSRRRDQHARRPADGDRRRRLPRALDRRPDAQIVKGYRAGIMAPAIAGFDLSAQARRHPRARRLHQVAEITGQASQRRASTTPRTGSAISFTPSRAM